MDVPVQRDRRKGYRRTMFTRFRTLVEENYRQRWSIADYAASMGISESRLNRICRSFTRKTAFEVVQDRILLEAQRYLVYTAAPISEIAYELGFNDPAYFCRFFKKKTGRTAKAFRQERSA